MEFREYLRPLLKWWWLVVSSTLIAGVASYIAVLHQPPVYQARTTLIVGRLTQDPNPNTQEIWMGQQLALTYTNIAQREPLRTATMQALGMNWLPEYVVKPVPNTQLIEIMVTDTDPVRASAVANELAHQLILTAPGGQEDQQRVAFINQQLNDLEARIRETQTQIQEQQAALEDMVSARQIADAQNRINALQSKLTTLQANYASLLSNTQGGALNSLSIVEPAVPPERPSGPNILFTVLTSALLGLSLAGAGAYLLEYLDNSIKTPEDIKKSSGLPTLAGIAYIKGERYPDKLITLKHPRSPIAESYRSLRTAILFTMLDQPPGSVILVTSPNPTEGKSVTVANLAVVMAQAGQRVLLIDADLRRPTQHQFFESPSQPGLTDLLLEIRATEDGETVLFQAAKVIQPTPVDKLFLLPCGSIPPNPSELLGSSKMRVLIDILKSRFDFILMDSPPGLVVTDALVISSYANQVLLVTDAGQTTQPQLKALTERLQEINAPIKGCVLNRLKGHSDGYYYYYQHYTYYKTEELSQPDTSQKQTNGKGKWWEQWLREFAVRLIPRRPSSK